MKDLFSLKGKVALVTGGSRGIGAMIARGYVESGAKVYISARKEAECAATAEELSKLSADAACIAIPADLSTEAGCKGLADAIAAREPKLDILVNNAGANWGAPLAEFPDSGWDRVLNVNVKGPFFVIQQLMPLLAAGATQDDPARIINIGSIDGLKVPFLETYSYSASKAAVHHMTRVLAVHLAPRHITVNAVAPGPFESKMMAVTLDRFKDAIVAACPLGRIGEPEDMAGVAIYLASRAGAYVTGVVIPVDGGITVRPS